MTAEHFQRVYPYLSTWIELTLRNHGPRLRSVASAGFKRLPQYFSGELLAQVKFVSLPMVPIPPLTAMGLAQFSEFEGLAAGGITFVDTYFVRRELEFSERLHFHELIHVVQWETLGPERFLLAYADGLERFGYRECPFEKMAYEAEEAFVRGGTTFDAESLVRTRLDDLFS